MQTTCFHPLNVVQQYWCPNTATSQSQPQGRTVYQTGGRTGRMRGLPHVAVMGRLGTPLPELPTLFAVLWPHMVRRRVVRWMRRAGRTGS
jgi:hypothetical protein